MRNALLRAWGQVRAQDWWAYKIPPLASAAFGAVLMVRPEPLGALATIAALVVSISFVAAYGYVINDVFDIDDDRRAGKANSMAGKPVWFRIALLAATAAGAFAPVLLVAPRTPLLVLTAANLLLPTLYSVPPVRWKERGIWGALADTAAARAVPAASMIAGVALPANPPLLLLAGAAGSAFFAGLRGIITHQVRDAEADQAAGAITFARRIGQSRARAFAMRFVYPCEIAFLVLWLAVLIPAAPLVAAATLLYGALEWMKIRAQWKLPQFEAPEASHERYLPLVNNEFYEVWLPLALALQLVFVHPVYAPVPLLVALAFYPNIRARLRGSLPLFRRTASDGQSIVPDGQATVPNEQSIVPDSPESSPFPEIIVGATAWTVNGVNAFSANLVRGLRAAGYGAHVLLTEEECELVDYREQKMPRPADIPFVSLPVGRWDSWGTHWGALIRYLEDRAPCIYIPNSDYRHSGISPMLSGRVRIVGIAHSDDPLHYDHVRRLGKYWDTVVTVSRAIRAKIEKECPDLAPRLATIPIGVAVPDRMPPHTDSAALLRVIYHGILKQHQKRVLDLPRIVDAALRRGVPLVLSIAGSGPDEEALREASRPLVERGAIRFLGVQGQEDLGRLLDEHDVFLLPSEFEGMPNALIESMAHGCVPLVSRMESGIPELVREGENGLLAACGDPEDFAAHLEELWRDGARRHRLAAAAYQTVAAGEHSARAMSASYIRVFEQVMAANFARPAGPLEPIPAAVAGVSILPVELAHREPGTGDFLSLCEARDFLRASGRAATARPRTSQSKLNDVHVVVASPVWARNGVNAFAEDLVRGLQQSGLRSRLLLTEERTSLVRVADPRLPRPSDIPVDELSVSGPECWGRRWGAMQRYLLERAPCIYIPNYDWRHSCVVPQLPDSICAIGMVHAEDPLYFDHVRRLGRYFNAIVAPGSGAAVRMRAEFPDLAPKLTSIPPALNYPAVYPERRPGSILRVLVAGVSDGSERVSREIGALVGQCTAAGLPLQFTCIPRSFGKDAWRRLVSAAEPSRDEWLALCDAHDVILTSCPSPQLPDRLRQAMARGCVPVLAGGHMPAHVFDARTGFHVPHAEATEVRSILLRLAIDRALWRSLSEASYGRAKQGMLLPAEMIEEYLSLFERIRAAAMSGTFRRPRAPLDPPPTDVAGIGVFPFPARFLAEGVGAFPSEKDYSGYMDELNRKEMAVS